MIRSTIRLAVAGVFLLTISTVVVNQPVATAQAPATGEHGPNANDKKTLEAAMAFAKAVAGKEDSPAYFTLLEQALKNAQAASMAGRMGHGAAAHKGHAGTADITSPFAHARVEAFRKGAELANIRNNKTWQANRVKLIQDALKTDPSRIIGGKEALAGEFPHCVAVGRDGSFCCTGTLIGPNVVLTAGHCVDGDCARRIYVGLDSNNPALNGLYKVKATILHKDYNPVTLANDIGLLILDKDVESVTPCPIAEEKDIDSAFYLRLAGYGFTELGKFGVQYKVDVAIVTAHCKDEMSPGLYGCHPGKEIVAGGGGVDSCNGDSGGPAYVVKAGKLYLAGSTSRATRNSIQPCGDGGIYVRTDKYLDWIKTEAKAKGGKGF